MKFDQRSTSGGTHLYIITNMMIQRTISTLHTVTTIIIISAVFSLVASVGTTCSEVEVGGISVVETSV